MAKNNRSGQAEIWNSNVIKKLRSLLTSPKQRLIFEISLWTGERMGAITQLRVEDVYDDRGRVKEHITFRGLTRKASKHGTAKTRQCYIHDDLKLFLAQYQAPKSGYLFPSTSASGHITRRGVDYYWRTRLKDLGFNGFSTHSSRRWVINRLREKNVAIVDIAETMAMNVITVRHYLDNNSQACQSAIASLDIAA